jgi:hypothetical protein
MKTAKEWNQKIIDLSQRITREFPELSKYISEIPVKISEKYKPGATAENLKEYYNSLAAIVRNYSPTHGVNKTATGKEDVDFPGYPMYAPSEDIFSHEVIASNINPEDLANNKSPYKKKRSPNEKAFEDDVSGEDLDVPGSELDDEQEYVGSEDEENNYYSLGGDDHADLDENNGER